MALRLLLGMDRGASLTVFGLALFFTYALHALLWTGAAALLARRSRLSPATRHALWKLALFGPLVTTLLTVVLAHTGEGVPQDRQEQVLLDAGASAQLVDVSRLNARANTFVGVEIPTFQGSRQAWTLLAVCLAAAALLGLLRFAILALCLVRSLRSRTPVADARLLSRLLRLRAQSAVSHVVLSESAHVHSPLILGLAEICLPAAWLGTLDDAEVDSVFGHELAHLERRDGLWFPLVGFVQSVLWMQPLNHALCARLRETAELACDDRAVALTGDPSSLARALTRVAAGALSARLHDMVPAMARSASGLCMRVQRLVGARSELSAPAGGRRVVLASLALFGLLTMALSVQGARARSERMEAGGAPRLTSSVDVPPDAAALSEQMSELAGREAELGAELASVQAELQRDARLAGDESGAEQIHRARSLRLLELEQALRHVRATQRWLEQRFVRESATGERTTQRPGTQVAKSQRKTE